MAANQEHSGGSPPGPRGGRKSKSWKVWRRNKDDGPRQPGAQSEADQCRVYNLSCERYLSEDVKTADLTVSDPETRVQTHSPTATTALWLMPFSGNLPANVRLPVDLLFLDRECVVIDAVESFPIFSVSPSCHPAASVLVLPPNSIASTSTRAGNQLIFRPPTEMKLLLDQLAKMRAESEQDRAAEVSGAGQSSRQVLPLKDPSRSEPELPVSDHPPNPQRTIAPFEIASESEVERFPAEPTPEEVPLELVAQEVPAEPTAEEVLAELMQEDVPAEPVAQEVPAKPMAQEVPVEPTAEEVPAKVTPEDVHAEPAPEEVPAKVTPEDVHAEPMAHEVPAEPVAQYVLAEPMQEGVPAEPMAQEVPAEPVQEGVPAEPMAQEVPAEPVAQDVSPEPTTEEVPAKPLAQYVPAEPMAQYVPAKPMAQEVPAEPVAQYVPVEPAALELPAEPTPEEVPAEPVAQELPAELTLEEVPAKLVKQEVPAEPMAQEGPAKLPAQELPAEPMPEEVPTEPTTQPAPQDPGALPTRKNWLQRLLSTKREDQRGALRESIPGLTAFFFTGGPPVPHGVRDVSETGVYVLTDERWYPGTVVRITLTDQREPTAERSFTINASVMRWGNDGVGLHFVFQDKKDRRRGNPSVEDRAMGVTDAATFKQYLGTLRGAKR